MRENAGGESMSRKKGASVRGTLSSGQKPQRKTPLMKRLLARVGGGGGKAAVEEEEADQAWLAPRVRQAEYFHGMIHKDEIPSLLKEEGDTILRLGRSTAAAQNVTISLLGNGKTRHFIVDWEGAGKKRRVWVDKEEKFIDEVDLVEAYQSRGLGMGVARYPIKRLVHRADWELEAKDLEMLEELGHGAFGRVHLARLIRSVPRAPGPVPLPVAVKLCDSARSSQELQNRFMKEAEIGRRLSHPNIIRIIAVQCREHPLMIVMEFAAEGSLLGWLRSGRGRESSEAERLSLAADAAGALHYIHQRHILHRDIAARNFLLGRERCVKMCDFGHARADTTRYTMKTHIRLATKWCAPEVLSSGIFSQASDVWSLGVTCWEILAQGDDPFPDINKKEVKRLVIGPQRLCLKPRPNWSAATEEIFNLTFAFTPEQRADVADVHAAINRARGRPTSDTTLTNTNPTSSHQDEKEQKSSPVGSL